MSRTSSSYLADRFIALAHRGGALLPANEGIENTALAFRNAYQLGYRYLETDVQLTRDGELVAFHDDTLRRVTGAAGCIADYTADELRSITVGGQPIASLEELFTALPQARFNIDLKVPAAIEPLVAFIKEHRATDRVCVGSFDRSSIGRFRELVGDQVATSCSSTEVARLAVPTVINRRFRLRGDVFQLPEVYPVAGHHLRLITPGSIRRAQAAGAKVHVWTINEASDMHRLIDWGVDGLVTDAIDVLRGVLIERNLWSEAE